MSLARSGPPAAGSQGKLIEKILGRLIQIMGLSHRVI
jgi:hypothetical protein